MLPFDATGYALTKIFLQRGIAAIYLVAFLVALRQFLSGSSAL